MKKLLILLIPSFFFMGSIEAQFIKKLGKTMEDAAKRTVERRAENKASETTDKAIDKVLDKKGKQEKDSNSKDKNTNSNSKAAESSSENSMPKLSGTSKFDFVPGDKILAIEDFSQDAVGDFPDKWDTDGSGEVMTVSNKEGKWFAMTRSGAFTPEFIKSLPENFTLEFDVAVQPNFDHYEGELGIAFARTKGAKEFNQWKKHPAYNSDYKKAGVMVWIHPQQHSMNKKLGRSSIEIWENGNKSLTNEQSGIASFNSDRTNVHVAIWRQNQRIRVYLNEEKVWDLPKAFSSASAPNQIVFSREDMTGDNNYFISNVRFAAGAPDTRNKLMTEGKFSTSGIYFNTASAQIKPESHGIIKEIADVLQDNTNIKIEIIGHTDNTGDLSTNQKLSEERALSVKNYLIQTFGISADRMTTSGKGASQPLASNNTAEGKSQNRRVEFIKK